MTDGIELEQWQQQRIEFYNINNKVIDFLNKYFNVSKGKRCIVGHVKDMYKLKRQPTYRIYGNNQCRALTIPDAITNTYSPLKDYWTVHSYMYIFNECVLNWTNLSMRKEIMKNSLVGLNAVIELDSPEVPNSETAVRTSFFDYIQDFDLAINHIDKKLTNLGEDYNLMFSGNGIYIILEGYYEDNLQDYITNFINLIDTLKEVEGLGNSLKVHVDNKSAPWNDYFKIPFTFHEKRQRISIPLPKEKLDEEWIDYISHTDNIINNNHISWCVNDIIKKANWKKLW